MKEEQSQPLLYNHCKAKEEISPPAAPTPGNYLISLWRKVGARVGVGRTYRDDSAAQVSSFISIPWGLLCVCVCFFLNTCWLARETTGSRSCENVAEEIKKLLFNLLWCFWDAFLLYRHRAKALWIIIGSGPRFTTKQPTEANKERIFISTKKLTEYSPVTRSLQWSQSCGAAWIRTPEGRKRGPAPEVCFGFITASLHSFISCSRLCLVGGVRAAISQTQWSCSSCNGLRRLPLKCRACCCCWLVTVTFATSQIQSEQPMHSKYLKCVICCRIQFQGNLL